MCVNIGSNITTHNEEEYFFGIKLDSNLLLEKHCTNLCKKANQKLHALARIVSYMDLGKDKCLMKIFTS